MRLPPRVGLLIACGLFACEAPRPSHILILSIDSLRADHLGCYGYERETSPHIDRLASEGVLFERALSSTSWTLPAHAALFTGLADSLHGVTHGGRALAAGIPTLAERLSEEGWATAAVVSGPHLHPRYGLSRGFDEYLGCMSYLDAGFRPKLSGNLHAASHQDVTGPCVVEQAGAWLDEHRDGPALLFLHFWDVHYDYLAPQPWAGRFDPEYLGSIDSSDFAHNPAISPDMESRDLEHVVALYDEEIAFTDSQIGEILARLDALGLRETTLVVLLADHGEAFFEHSRKGHQKDLHAEAIRIPLVLRGPGVPTGVRRPGPASITDVMPTVLEMLGLIPDRPTGAGSGRSLVGALGDANALADRLIFTELYAKAGALVSLEGLEQKLVRDLRTRDVTRYDLSSDPLEQEPRRVSEADSKALTAYRTAVRLRAQEFPEPDAVVGIDPQSRQRLKELGYGD